MPAKFSRREALASIAGAAVALASDATLSTRLGDLKVSPNHRYLTYNDGRPFFYLGDTAWELFHRLNREEVDLYLDDRAAKRFTVIQAVALAEFDGVRAPNSYGETPLRDQDPTKPNDAYFKHVDYVMKAAGRRGLYVGLLPTWGNLVAKAGWDKDATPVIFNETNARTYGQWLGRRYAGAPNLIWILGGDRSPAGVEPVWRAMAEGLRNGDRGRHLITYHPNGWASSADLLHDEPWLDFNMVQSGHSKKNTPNYTKIRTDYNRTPPKPCMDAEPRYENHPVNWKPDLNGWFDEHDVRQAAYWALFAGAHGHTYGCHDIWQFLQPGRTPAGLARGEWRTSLKLPGAQQMAYVRKLMESRPMLSRVPDQSMLVTDAGDGAEHLQATRGDGYAFAYTPYGMPVTLRLDPLGAKTVRASWYDPRSGQSTAAGEHSGRGEREFTPPGSPGRGIDWILVVDDAEARRT